MLQNYGITRYNRKKVEQNQALMAEKKEDVMKSRRSIVRYLLAFGMTVALSVPAFGEVYQKSDERYPEVPVMIVFDSAESGKYALGLDGNQWIVKPLSDITAIDNDDPRFLFVFEESEKNQQWDKSDELWEANHKMAIRGASGYLDFDATPENFLNATPKISPEPAYHWNYVIYDEADKRANLYYTGSYETARMGGSLWVKANAQKTWIKMVTGGRGPYTYLYQATEGATVPGTAGGWQEYKKSNNTCWKYFNSDGSLKQNEWYQENGKWYYFGDDGVTAMGFCQLPDGNRYYFKTDGSMLTDSEISMQGIPYRIGTDGICREVPADSLVRTAVSITECGKEDELLNWINLKRSELGIQPVYRDNRLSEIAFEISGITNGIVDWQTLHNMGLQHGIEFTRRYNLRMNWNEKYKNLRLEDYYKNAGLGDFVNLAELNHIGLFIVPSRYVSSYDCILVGGTYVE